MFCFCYVTDCRNVTASAMRWTRWRMQYQKGWDTCYAIRYDLWHLHSASVCLELKLSQWQRSHLLDCVCRWVCHVERVQEQMHAFGRGDWVMLVDHKHSDAASIDEIFFMFNDILFSYNPCIWHIPVEREHSDSAPFDEILSVFNDAVFLQTMHLTYAVRVPFLFCHLSL